MCPLFGGSTVLQIGVYILYFQFIYLQCAQIIPLYVTMLIAFPYSGSVMVLMTVETTVMKTIALQVKHK